MRLALSEKCESFKYHTVSTHKMSSGSPFLSTADHSIMNNKKEKPMVN